MDGCGCGGVYCFRGSVERLVHGAPGGRVVVVEVVICGVERCLRGVEDLFLGFVDVVVEGKGECNGGSYSRTFAAHTLMDEAFRDVTWTSVWRSLRWCSYRYG